MTIFGVDYAGDHPDPKGLYAAGKRFVVRYGGPGGDWKHLTAAEARALTAAGLVLVANAEGSASGLLSGWSAGADWARQADQHFRGLGMPAGRPIYLSVDFDVTSTQWPAVREALKGAASVIGVTRVGVYGGRRAVEWARRDGVARWFWQTYAWSGGVWVKGNHIEQYNNGEALAGGTVDLCRALVVDYGQWTLGTPQSEEDELDATERTWLQRIHQRQWAMEQLHDTVDMLGESDEANPLATAVKGLRTGLAEVKTALAGLASLTLTDAQVDRIADRLVAAADTPLGEADKPAIVAAVKDALREGTGA